MSNDFIRTDGIKMLARQRMANIHCLNSEICFKFQVTEPGFSQLAFEEPVKFRIGSEIMVIFDRDVF